MKEIKAKASFGYAPNFVRNQECPVVAVRPEGANHQWREIPPRELSIDLEADEQPSCASSRTESQNLEGHGATIWVILITDRRPS
jgi:hypothetical protein